MWRLTVSTILLLLLSPLAIQASNLRATSTLDVSDSAGESVFHTTAMAPHRRRAVTFNLPVHSTQETGEQDHERRRLQIANYWTKERISQAIPKHLKLDKVDVLAKNTTRSLQLAGDVDDTPHARNLRNPNQYLFCTIFLV